MGLKPRGGSSPLQRIGTPARGFRVFGNNSGVIVLWLLVLAGALVLVGKSRQRGLGRRGWPWFAAWVFAGALCISSLSTGFNIGLALFMVGTLLVFWLALEAPYGRELAGLPVGISIVLLALVLV